MARGRKKTANGGTGAGAGRRGALGLAREWAHIPKLVVFDLDFTLWHPEMYELDGAPFRKHARTGAVTDCRGTQVHLFDAVHAVLSVLETDPQFADTRVAVASSTTEPQWAKTCMRLLDVRVATRAARGQGAQEEDEDEDEDEEEDGQRHGGAGYKALQSIVDFEAIYPRNKRVHFKQLAGDSGLPYDDMLFFDNEYGNISNVGALGVVCCYCPRGLSEGAWVQGMEAFQQAKAGRGQD